MIIYYNISQLTINSCSSSILTPHAQRTQPTMKI